MIKSLVKIGEIFVAEKKPWWEWFGDDTDNEFPLESGRSITDNQKIADLVLELLIYAGGGMTLTFIFVAAYGAFTWIKSGDNEESIRKARKTFVNGIIGVLLAFSSVIVIYVVADIIGADFNTLWEINIFQ